MATHDHRSIGNIFDVLKFKLPNGSVVDSVVNTLAKRDELSIRVPAFPANNGLSHTILRTTSLPTGYLVDIGGSWKSSKSAREPAVETLCTIRSSYEAPKDTFQNEAPAVGQALLSAEKSNHVMALAQGLTNLMISGTTDPNLSAITGLMKRSPWTALDYAYTFSAGGTGSNLRSAWLIKPGVDTFHMLYNPNHPTLGIEMEDKGEHRVDGLGTGTDEHRYDICIEFMLQKGFCIRDQRAVKRIANVACGISDDPGADLINAIIDASIINAPTGGTMQANENGSITELPSPWLLMCDERLYSKLVRTQNNKLMVYQSAENIYRTMLPMIGSDIIICRLDALNHVIGSGETAVTA